MRHRASTDTLWKPLFDREFPQPADAAAAAADQQQQRGRGQSQTSSHATQQQQSQLQQGQGGAGAGAPAGGGGSSSSSGAGGGAGGVGGQRANHPSQQQQQQPPVAEEPPLHSRLQYLLSHGQRYTLRTSLMQLRQEAGRRGWRWAFGAAWTQRARLLAEAAQSRCAQCVDGEAGQGIHQWADGRRVWMWVCVM